MPLFQTQNTQNQRTSKIQNGNLPVPVIIVVLAHLILGTV